MIHLIVGNTGSGKTTYSEKLKTETGGVIFSVDRWNNMLFLPDKSEEDGLQWFLERIDRAEKMILSLVDQLEESGVDSILDLGLSKYSHRHKFRDYGNRNGLELKLHFLDISKEIRLERILQRNREKGSTFEFEVSRENFEFMEEWFEKPTEQELKGGYSFGRVETFDESSSTIGAFLKNSASARNLSTTSPSSMNLKYNLNSCIPLGRELRST